GKIAVGRKNGPDELVGVDHLKGSAFRSDREGADAAPGRIAAKIAEEEMTGIALGQGGGAGIVAKTGRPIGDVSERRNDVSRLAFMRQVPQFLGVPRTAVAH